MVTIKIGSKGATVKTLQEALNMAGYSLAVDGIFGSLTETAVRDYQKKHSLSVDGVVGAKTWSALGFPTAEPAVSARMINEIVIHCSATREGQKCTSDMINAAHKARKFSSYIDPKTGKTMHIGYHFLVHQDGTIEACRPESVRGNHAVNHNANSLGICYIGGLDAKDKNGTMIKDTRTTQQKQALINLIKQLKAKYPTIKKVIGHRDTSPDRNGNGIIEPSEWLKGCPCFNAIPEYKHLI